MAEKEEVPRPMAQGTIRGLCSHRAWAAPPQGPLALHCKNPDIPKIYPDIPKIYRLRAGAVQHGEEKVVWNPHSIFQDLKELTRKLQRDFASGTQVTGKREIYR